MYIYIFLNYQLPPVIKNMAFQKFSNMEQSLFTRFVRLCVPTVELDAQGRARSRYELFKPRLILSSNPGISQFLSPGGGGSGKVLGDHMVFREPEGELVTANGV